MNTYSITQGVVHVRICIRGVSERHAEGAQMLGLREQEIFSRRETPLAGEHWRDLEYLK
jgi:hypothetical protein